jgi:hypothetical protein
MQAIRSSFTTASHPLESTIPIENCRKGPNSDVSSPRGDHRDRWSKENTYQNDAVLRGADQLSSH